MLIKEGNDMRKRYILKNKIWIIIFLLAIIGSLLISVSMKKAEESTVLYSYQINRKTNYNVQLKENNFYDQNILSEKESYPSNLIEKIQLNYNYSCMGNKRSDYNYIYNITADIVGTYEDKEIWRKNYILTKSTTSTENATTTLEITPEINIDYQYYKNLVNSYAEANNLLIDAYLEVKLNINIVNNIETVEESQELADEIVVRIPLNNSVTEIEQKYQEISSDSILEPKTLTNKDASSVILLVFGILCIIMALILVILKIGRRTISDKEKYKKNISRILKDYPELIVTVANRPNIDQLNLMRLIKLSDLVDSAEQNKTNIIHYELYKNKKSILYVITGKFVYIYVVTSEEIE